MRETHETITWSQLWDCFRRTWKDDTMLKAFGPDKQTQLLSLTAEKLFLEKTDNKNSDLIREALRHLNSGGFFQEGGPVVWDDKT